MRLTDKERDEHWNRTCKAMRIINEAIKELDALKVKVMVIHPRDSEAVQLNKDTMLQFLANE